MNFQLTLIAKKTAFSIIAFVLLFSSISFFIPVGRSSALSESGAERIFLAGLATCLNHVQAIDEGENNITTLTDYWDDDGTKEVVAVGLGIDQTNGMRTCNEVVPEAIRILGISDAGTDDALYDDLFEAITGTPITNIGADGVDGDTFESQANQYITNVVLPAIQQRPETAQDVAERYLPLVELCFNHSDQPFGSGQILGFETTAQDGSTVYVDFNPPDRDEVIASFGMDRRTQTLRDDGDVRVGDIPTNREYGGADYPGRDNRLIDPDWRFYPYGNDVSQFLDFNANNQRYRDNGVLLSCNDIANNQTLIDGLYSNYSLNGDQLLFNGQSSDALQADAATDFGSFSDGADNPTCESEGFSLSWLICPLINAILDSLDWMFRQFIEPFLVIQPLTTNEGDFAYEVWQGFRTLGNIVLAFALLFIVFGQAIGGGLVDAYTAKKAMPRILVAAIGINLSFFVVAATVDIFNVIGSGIGRLITAPLDGQGSFNFSPGNLISATGILAILLGGDWLLQAVGQAGFFPMIGITVLLPALLITIAIFGTVIIRRGIIITLAVISPVAVALYAIPATEKYAKQWFSLLVKTLLVYPIIMAIFAIADLMSVMFFNASSDGIAAGFLVDFVGLVVLFIPFFLIPFSFKLAGGIIGSVAGAITNFENKRKEKFMGSEFDPKSRLNQAKQTQYGIKNTRKGHRSQFFQELSQYRRGGKDTGNDARSVTKNAFRGRYGQARERFRRLTDADYRDLHQQADEARENWNQRQNEARNRGETYTAQDFLDEFEGGGRSGGSSGGGGSTGGGATGAPYPTPGATPPNFDVDDPVPRGSNLTDTSPPTPRTIYPTPGEGFSDDTDMKAENPSNDGEATSGTTYPTPGTGISFSDDEDDIPFAE